MEFSPDKVDPDAFGFGEMKLFSRGRSRRISNRLSSRQNHSG
jgi:hypothetical protein